MAKGEIIAYILFMQGEARSVILASSQDELGKKLAKAVEIEVQPDQGKGIEKTSVRMGDLGDWGEETMVMASYVKDGQLIQDHDITIMKTIHF